ncbi:hypothetical protein [Anaerovorax sp. IOR16]|uniref:hypothetical protein n=1 Tax=Anaerovorax sp. IOR16 TaxID=2773458 RepID=UPI0019D29BE9|nr:hypothetical protein [Anaerovorax sp. IOR16]
MFKIIAPNEEYTREIAGVHFIDGKAETENETVARWLEGRGFEVIQDEKTDKKPIGKMTVEELEAYAAEIGADISGCSNKEEKKAAIIAFSEQK